MFTFPIKPFFSTFWSIFRPKWRVSVHFARLAIFDGEKGGKMDVSRIFLRRKITCLLSTENQQGDHYVTSFI